MSEILNIYSNKEKLVDREREIFEKEYLKLRKTDDGNYSANIGDDKDELLTRNGEGYLYGSPDFAWKIWKARARISIKQSNVY